ncbi:hypothetical protein [Streptomyces sp. Da 82-17]|uniref:hypothetical protein n=1 Tax=Streptomyces sp. Da 82-17 TaxID=3377116 RepID=UPI0038D42C11
MVRAVGVGVGGVGTGVVGVLLLGRAWRDCDIGINAAANSFGLAFVFLGLSLVAGLWWWLVLARLGAVGTVVALLGSALLVWGVMAWLHAPDGYPSPFCGPGNVPAWWPDLLPL